MMSFSYLFTLFYFHISYNEYIYEDGKCYINNQNNIVDQILNVRNEMNETKLLSCIFNYRCAWKRFKKIWTIGLWVLLCFFHLIFTLFQ